MTKLITDPQVQLVQKKIADLQAQKAVQPVKGAYVVSETHGLKVLLVPISAFDISNQTSFVLPESGYSIYVAKAGSDPLAVKVDLNEAGVYGPLYPGASVRSDKPFSRIAMKLWQTLALPKAGNFTSAGATLGLGTVLTLVIGKTKEAVYSEPSEGGGFEHFRSGFQVYNSTANVPTNGVIDGINARNAKAIRCFVDIRGGNINAGTVVWWYCNANGSWWQTDFQQPLPQGSQLASPAEFEVDYRSGFYFPELRSVTGDAGPLSNLIFYVASYGEGGELNPGDIT